MSDLAELTTLRVGGPARSLLRADGPEELLAAVRDVDAEGGPLLLVGGGSNLLVADDGFPGTVVHVMGGQIQPQGEADLCGGALVEVGAGVGWDRLVRHAVDAGWAGLETLSGIPGSTGATPVQNVGAYGSEVGDTIARVQVYDRVQERTRTLAAGDCGFGYRDSVFKRAARDGPGGTERYVVLRVLFQFAVSELSAPVRYVELARRLGVDIGERVPTAAVRTAVLELRAAKGMVLDAADHDTWSVGSFFTNPLLDATTAAALPADAPRWDAGAGRVKVSAAWLIEHAGISRGHGLPGPAAVSTRHTLALTNRGGATAADVVTLAREVREAVRGRFGVLLVPEPRLVGISL